MKTVGAGANVGNASDVEDDQPAARCAAISGGGIGLRRNVENIPDSLRNMVASLGQSRLNEGAVHK
jgi:hypothetical protein